MKPNTEWNPLNNKNDCNSLQREREREKERIFYGKYSDKFNETWVKVQYPLTSSWPPYGRESTHAAMSWNTSVYPFSIKFYNIEPELFVRFFSMTFSFDANTHNFFLFGCYLYLWCFYPRIIIAMREKKVALSKRQNTHTYYKNS